jgi:hypothetical protein
MGVVVGMLVLQLLATLQLMVVVVVVSWTRTNGLRSLVLFVGFVKCL